MIAGADRILAPTPVGGGAAGRACTAPTPSTSGSCRPASTTRSSVPRDRAAARERLHLSGLRLALYVGRLQPHKGPDVAVRTLAEAVARDPESTRDLVLAIVGGPSGTDQGAEVARLMELAAALGVSERVMLFPPQPQARLADFYAAADVVLVPSRSESFGLVALEAQACGTPVVAAAVGRPAVRRRGRADGVPRGGPRPRRPRRADAADPARPGARRPLGRRGARAALRFTWDATAHELRRSTMRLHQVELWSLAENERALRAYAHSGFREEARLAERSWKDGRWVDRVLMSVTRERFDAARTARDQHER